MRGRQVGVTASMIFAIVGSLIGSGVLGTSVESSSEGELSADATLIAPAGTAFSIWSVIYLCLIAYTVWQWRTRVAATRRHRTIAVPVMFTMILNAAWILVTQQGWVWVSVLVIVALLVACAMTLKGIHDIPADTAGGTPEKIVTDGTFGLYLGWVCVAICANIAAAAVGSGLPGAGTVPTILAVAVIIAVVVVGALLARRFGGRLAVATSIVWGLAWIAAGRLTDEPASTTVGLSAAVAAVGVAAITLVERPRARSHAEATPTTDASEPARA